MTKYGIPERNLKMVRVFYDDFQYVVEHQGEACEWFVIETCVKLRRLQCVRMSVLDCYGLGNAKNIWL